MWLFKISHITFILWCVLTTRQHLNSPCSVTLCFISVSLYPFYLPNQTNRQSTRTTQSFVSFFPLVSCFLRRLKKADFIMLVHKKSGACASMYLQHLLLIYVKKQNKTKKTPILAVFKLFMATPPQLLAAAVNSHTDVKYK